MGRRFLLFALTNLGVLLTISLVTQLLGLDHYLTERGINYTSLLVFCGLWGFGGAFVSLWMSKRIAKWTMRVEVISPNQPGPYGDLVRIVHRQAQAAGLGKMPEVGVYPSGEVNAFATGPSRDDALVAVSAGLLQRMDRAEVEGVLGHEVAHIANGDMVTMTLIQGVVNAFTMFLARILASIVGSMMQGDEEEGPSFMLHLGLVFLFDMVFTLLGSVVVNYFSRQREYRADAGGANLAGREKMLAALHGLRHAHQLVDRDDTALASLKINGAPRSLSNLFLTHPPIEQRIKALQLGSQSRLAYS